MKIEAHLDKSEIERIKADIEALEKDMGKVAITMDSLTEHLWILKNEVRQDLLPAWVKLMEESEDELHG